MSIAGIAGVHSLGFAGDLSLWPLLGLVALAGVTVTVARRTWGPDCSRFQLHLRLAAELLATTAVIYAMGWGPMLAVGYLVIVADNLRISGSRAWRPAAAWVVVSMAVGQGTIAVGLVPSNVASPLVHGLAVLAALGVVFVIRFLGMMTETVEQEASERGRAEQRFRALVQNSFDVVSVVDVSGTVIYVSPNVEEVCGYRVDDYLARGAHRSISSTPTTGPGPARRSSP